MTVKIERFNREYFKSLKTQKEKEDYFIKYIKKALSIMDKGGKTHDN